MISAPDRGKRKLYERLGETGATIMMQSDVTFDRAAGAAKHDDEDALFDSWLASLSSREFELVLNTIADFEVPARLEASA
jgi:hypothetical protein